MYRIWDIVLPEMTPLKSDRPPGEPVPLRRDCIRTRKRTCFLCLSRVFCGTYRTAIGLLLLAVIVLAAQPQLARAQTDTATYTVTFTGNWNTQSTPGGVAGGAHFTTLIGAVHNSGVTFWAAGQMASPGVESVAEIGGTGTLRTEISNAASGTVKSTVSQSGTGATGSRTFTVEFSRTHPLLTLLSMIGPSPDWFVGVNGLSMLDGSDWRSSHTVDLFAYDAGTEDGENFSLNNAATDPQGVITSLRNTGKFSAVRMARLTFTLNTPPPQNNAPEFSGATATRSFTETVGDATVQSAGNIGMAVTATDDDSDMLTYSLEGMDRNRFTIDSESGQIRTKVGQSYDYETRLSYSVTVKADDENGGTDTIDVTIDVTDISEPPLAPSAPSVSLVGGGTMITVSWNPPNNTGRPAITGYNVRYRQGTSGSWTGVPQGNISGMSATTAVSDANAQYQAQVLATNSDGDGPWSQPGSNIAPPPPSPSPPPPPPVEEAEEIEDVCVVSEVAGDEEKLKKFVECAARNIASSQNFGETLSLLEEFRDSEGDWNDGSTYLVLLTGRGGVYFHAEDREAEDLDWSGVLFCEGGGSALNTQEGCFIEYEGEKNGYAHPFSASSVPLVHGEGGFVLLGGFDGTPEGGALPGKIDGPSTEAGEVDTDEELREFVGEGGRALMVAIMDSGVDPAQLRGVLRQEGPWRKGDVHVYIMDETGMVIFDGADREREQKDESAKRYVRDLISRAGEEVVEYMEGGFLRRGYAVRVESPVDEEGNTHVYVVGSEYRVKEPPVMEVEMLGAGGSGGGGCAVGGSSSGGVLSLLLVALALLLTVLLKRHSVESNTRLGEGKKFSHHIRLSEQVVWLWKNL